MQPPGLPGGRGALSADCSPVAPTVVLALTVGAPLQAEEGPEDDGGRCRHGDHRMNPEAVRARAEFATDQALFEVRATDDQRTRVRQIVFAALDDMGRLRESHAANREAVMAVLEATTVDRARLESLRQAEMALADQASQRVTRALADAADVLSPEQRREIAGLLRRFPGAGGFGPGMPDRPGRS